MGGTEVSLFMSYMEAEALKRLLADKRGYGYWQRRIAGTTIYCNKKYRRDGAVRTTWSMHDGEQYSAAAVVEWIEKCLVDGRCTLSMLQSARDSE